jgi:alkaline phosphatase D
MMRAWFVLFSLCWVALAWAGLSAGPMAGPSTAHAVTIWLQGAGAGHARIAYWVQGKAASVQWSQTVALRAEEDFSAQIVLSGLTKGTRYEYRVRVEGQPVGAVHRFTTQGAALPLAFKIVTGSCVYINADTDSLSDWRPTWSPYGGDTAIFRAMAAAQPDLTLWLGDNLYYRKADTEDPLKMAARWRHDRATADLQPLLATGAHAAIWDDHDYGPNNSDRHFAHKDAALTLFKRYWAHPSYGLSDAPGIFSSLRHGDVEVFLLDNRWYRDPDHIPMAGKSQFGAPQLAWLKAALARSDATFKLIAGGSQFLHAGHRYEGWHHFPAEREAFIAWLTAQRIEGVLFLSGDRHATELLRWPRDAAYPLYELTCSPLTSGTRTASRADEHATLAAGTQVAVHNFCTLAFSGVAGQRQLTLRSHAADGRMLWQRDIPQSALSVAVPR